LVEHFSQVIADEQGNAVKIFDQKAIEALQEFSWTGNIRELRNVVERLIILGANPVTAEDVAAFVRK
jgi:DNA-binding NtrC family response regulator